MSANDSNFSTTLGTRIHAFASTAEVNNDLYKADVDISCKFFNHDYTISLSEWTKKVSYQNWHKPLPEILAPGAEKWKDADWIKFFDNFRKSHQDLLPNVIIVQFRTGYATVHKDLTASFDVNGRLLYAELSTNEGSIRWDGYISDASKIHPEDEASLTTFPELERYIRYHELRPTS